MNKRPIEVMKDPWLLQKLSFRSNTQTVNQLIDSQCVNNATASAITKPSRASVSVSLFLYSPTEGIKAYKDLH